MEWLNNRLGQIIAGVTVAGTLAGFGYEGAQTINRIDNIESATNDYITAVDGMADRMAELDKRMVAIDEQLKALDIPDIGTIEQDVAVLKTHTHETIDVSGLRGDIAVLKSELDNLEEKIKSDNPLAN